MTDVIDYLLQPGVRAFWEPFYTPKVDQRGPDECWLWKASTRRGYARFKAAGYNVTGSRLAWAMANGRSPGAMLVCHRCDNPPCVNPAHLFLGTDRDNSDDKIAKGRAVIPEQAGAANGNAKLDAEAVERIRARILAGETNCSIAEDFGVGHAQISRIRRGRSWGDEPMQPKYASLRTDHPRRRRPAPKVEQAPVRPTRTPKPKRLSARAALALYKAERGIA